MYAIFEEERKSGSSKSNLEFLVLRTPYALSSTSNSGKVSHEIGMVSVTDSFENPSDFRSPKPSLESYDNIDTAGISKEIIRSRTDFPPTLVRTKSKVLELTEGLTSQNLDSALKSADNMNVPLSSKILGNRFKLFKGYTFL
jgi:hypothetical protein